MFIRMYTGDDNQTHLDEMDMENITTGFQIVQKASVLEFSNNIPDNLEGWHNAPRRQWVIILGGSITISVGDGSSRTLVAGDVLLAEDVSGQGHTTVVNGGWPRAVIPIPANG